MDRREADGGFVAHTQHLRQRQFALDLQVLVERVAQQILHRDKRDAVLFTDVMDRDNVIAPNLCSGAGFTQEPLAGAGVCRVDR